MISLFLLRFVKAVSSSLERFCCGFLLYCLNDDNAVSLVFVFSKSRSFPQAVPDSMQLPQGHLYKALPMVDHF